MATVLEKHKIQLPAQTMTFAQFLKWVDDDDYAEWVDGAVIFKGTESVAHQALLGFLICLLGWFSEDHDAGQISFVLDAEGRSQRAMPDADGRYESAVLPGFWVSVGWLWQMPLPLVRSVFKEWEAASSH